MSGIIKKKKKTEKNFEMKKSSITVLYTVSYKKKNFEVKNHRTTSFGSQNLRLGQHRYRRLNCLNETNFHEQRSIKRTDRYHIFLPIILSKLLTMT